MFLGIDLGTSGVKIVIVDRSGHVVGESGDRYPYYGAEEGLFEQEPSDWKESIRSAVISLREKVPESLWKSIEAIGLSAQMPTMVLTDRDGEASCRAIVWSDARADEQGRMLLKRWGKDLHYCKTGVKLDGRYIIPMYLWMKENRPEQIPETHYILSAKDYIYFWMCGEAVTDPSTASGYAVYNINNDTWDDELCAEAGIQLIDLPAITHSENSSRKLKKELCKDFGLPHGVSVAVGAADSVAGVLGLGAVDSGTVCQICGSSTAIIAVGEKPAISPENKFFITPLAKTGSFGLEADILSTGKTSQWVAGILGKEVQWLSGIAQSAPPGSDGVIFTPYLAGGEQGVLWDPDLAGGLFGLSFNHSIAHIIRAHYEGICFESKRCIGAFEKDGFKVKNIMMSGPITSEPFFMQLMADVIGIECIASSVENASAYGAAILAGIGSGEFKWNSVAMHVPPGISYKPDVDRSTQYRVFYQRYLEASAVSRSTWKKA